MTDKKATRGPGHDAILQAFHWNLVKTQGTGTVDGRSATWYEVLAEMAEEVASLGFTVVYLPPPWRDDSAWEHKGTHGGGEGYFWHDFHLDSRYGSKAQLRHLVSALHRQGVRAVVDLVLTHRDATRMVDDRWPYPGPCWRGGAADKLSFLDGQFDLALGHPIVSARFADAMRELVEDCGIDGWRLDYVWGYPVDQLVSTYRSEAVAPASFCMGEYWQSDGERFDDPLVRRYGASERDRIVGWAREARSLAFDVLLKRQINTGNPRNLRHGLNSSLRKEERELAVTYVDTHDTGASPYSKANGWGQKLAECPPSFKSRAYAFILTMPGTPCVYWPDCFDWGFETEIAMLLAARRRAGIVAGSDWVDLSEQYRGFAAIVKNEAGDDALAVSISSDYAGPGEGWRVAFEKPMEWTVWLRG